ncbi:cohesin complex subunit [Massospora cicadina]|nr:cohesin complex subunit [Massospora cicadina]
MSIRRTSARKASSPPSRKPTADTKAKGSASASKRTVTGPPDAKRSKGLAPVQEEGRGRRCAGRRMTPRFIEAPVEAIYQLLAVVVKEAIRQQAPFNLVFLELQEGTKDDAEVPYLAKTKEGKLAKRRALEFFQSLVKHGLHDLFNDPTLVGFFKAWFTAMSSSPFRPFRQVGASLAFNFMTHLCGACRELESEQEITLQQTSARKPKAGSISKRKTRFKPQELATQIALLSTTLGGIFDTIFVKRCTDIEASIRAEAVKEFGRWGLQYPALFLDDAHLKHLNWRLSDKSPLVRLEAVNTIMSLCNNDNAVTRFRHFVNSAKARILEMATKDIDLGVQCHAIRLLLVVHKRGLLELDDTNRIIDLLFSKNEKTRLAVAPFIEHILEEELIPELARELKVKPDALSPSERRKLGLKAFMGLLAQACSGEPSESSTLRTPLLEYSHGFLLASRPSLTQGPVALAVRALWKEVYYLQDWEGLLDLVTQDTSAKAKKNSIQLTAAEEPWLLEIMETSFEILKEEHASEPAKKNSEPSAFAQLRNRLVQDHPIQSMLGKHGDNERLVAVLDGELFLEADKMKAHLEVVQLVVKIFSTHRSAQVLFQAASTLKALGRFKSATPHEFKQLLETVVDELVAAVTAALDDPEGMLLPLHRLHALLTVSGWDYDAALGDEYGAFAGGLWEAIDKARNLTELKVAVAALGMFYQRLLWLCRDLLEDEAKLPEAARLRDRLLHACMAILSTDSDEDTVLGAQAAAFRVTTEICWIHQKFPALKARPPLPALDFDAVEGACVRFVGATLAQWQAGQDAGVNYLYTQVVTASITCVINGVFGLSAAVEVVARFSSLGDICDEAIRSLFNLGVKPRLKAAPDGNAVRLIVQTLGDALTEALKRQANAAPLDAQDCAANLAKLMALTLRNVGGDAVRISKALALFHQATVWTAIQNIKVDPSNLTEVKAAMLTFRTLGLLLKGLLVPPHARDLLRQVKEASQEISPEGNASEWVPYYAYLKTLEEIQPIQPPQEPAKRPLEPEAE